MKESFVYLIRNQVNGKSYVGQTTWGRKRVIQHFRRGLTGGSGNKVFYEDIKKFGKENFIWGVIERTSPDLLVERETFWIKKLDTHNKGYNHLPQWWVVLKPDGTEETIYNLGNFCQTYNLTPSSMWDTMKGRRLNEKGFRLLPRTQVEWDIYTQTRKEKEEGEKLRRIKCGEKLTHYNLGLL